MSSSFRPARRPWSRAARFALLSTICLGLAACADAEADTESLPVALVIASTELNFAQEVAAGFRAGVTDVTSVPPVVTGPAIIDPARQVQMFKQVTADRIGGVSVFTLSPEQLAEPMRTVVDRGTPVIAVDNPPMPGSQVALFVGNDNVELGRMLADQVIAKLPADAEGDIVLGTSAPGTPVLDWRVVGMLAEFEKRLPRVRVLGPFDTKQEVAANSVAWKLLVRANPSALAFVGTGDADGWNLAEIRRRTGATWLAGGYDLDPRSLQAVVDGELLLVSPEHYAAGVITGHLLAQRSTSGRDLPEGWIEIPGLAVTADNVAEVIARQSSQTTRQAWFEPQTEDLLQHLDQNLRPLSLLD